MGILGKIKHRDKSPMNLLLARAVEICSIKEIPFLTYARYDYGKVGSDTLKEFKKNNGFENMIVPRYYVPITIYGRLLIKFKLHNGVKSLIPKNVIKMLRNLRNIWYSYRLS
jgi:hypothetical protein